MKVFAEKGLLPELFVTGVYDPFADVVTVRIDGKFLKDMAGKALVIEAVNAFDGLGFPRYGAGGAGDTMLFDLEPDHSHKRAISLSIMALEEVPEGALWPKGDDTGKTQIPLTDEEAMKTMPIAGPEGVAVPEQPTLGEGQEAREETCSAADQAGEGVEADAAEDH